MKITIQFEETPKELRTKASAALTELGFKVNVEQSVGDEIADILKHVKDSKLPPMIHGENYLELKGEKLGLTITDQVRYNGINYTFELRGNPVDPASFEDFVGETVYEDWQDLLCDHSHGELAEEITAEIILRALFGANPSEEVCEFFREGECELDFFMNKTDQSYLFEDYKENVNKKEVNESVEFDQDTGTDS